MQRYGDDINSGLYPTYGETEAERRRRAAKQQRRDERAARYANIQNEKAKKRAWNRQLFENLDAAARDPNFWEENYPDGGKQGWLNNYNAAIGQADANIASYKNPGGQVGGLLAVANAGERPDAAAGQNQRTAAQQQPTTAPVAAAQDVEQQQTTGFRTETRQVGGVEANVTTNPNNRVVKVQYGDPNSPGPSGRVELVDPNAQARGVPSPEQLAAYQNQQAAMRRYGNIMRPNGESDRNFNANSQVVVTPGRGRATNNPGYTFVGSAGDAARFFQSVPHGGGYNPYRQTIQGPSPQERYSEWLNKGRGQTQRDYEPKGWQGRRAKAQMEADRYKTDVLAAQGMNTAAMQDARARDQFGLQFAQTMGQMGTQELQNAQLRQQLAQNAQMNAVRQKMANTRPGSQEWMGLYKTAQALEGKYSGEEQPEYGFHSVKRDNGDGTSTEQGYVLNKRTGALTPAQMGGVQQSSNLFEGNQFEDLLNSDAGKRALQSGNPAKELMALVRRAQELHDAEMQGRR